MVFIVIAMYADSVAVYFWQLNSESKVKHETSLYKKQ